MEIGLLGAFLGGILTLLSPCSAMLLPAFFSYAFTGPKELVARTGVFYLGLVTTLAPLGVLAGTLGAFVNEHRFTFVTIRSEEHTSELQSRGHLVCRLLLETK